MYYVQGLDSLGSNFGSNPLLNYITRPRDYGFKIGSGNRAECLNTTFVASYELFENLFIDATALFRRYKTNFATTLAGNTKMLTIGLRWNIGRREYDY
jgi:hypothetical protein